MALTIKQTKFCQEYLIDLNATQAAIRAGYSKKTAMEQGYQLLHKTSVQQCLQQLQSELQTKTGITQERVLQEYAKIAFFDIRQIFDGDGNLIDISEFNNEAAGAVVSIEIDKTKTSFYSGETSSSTEQTVTKKIKIADKKGALDSLAKHLGMFEKDNKQSVPDILPASTLDSLSFEQLYQLKYGSKPKT